MKSRILSVLIMAGLFAPLAHADLRVTEVKPAFNFSVGDIQVAAYRVGVENTGAALDNVRGTLNVSDTDIRVFGRRLWFGDIGTFGLRTSFNGFLVIAPKSIALDDDRIRSALDIDYRFNFKPTLVGQVIDDPIPNAELTFDVGGVQTTVVADADGNYSTPLPLAGFNQFVSVNATGGPGQEFVELRSLVGTVLDLHDATGAAFGSTIIASDNVQALDVTHVTTAKAVLAEAINGGPITTGDELRAAEVAIDTLELLRVAATIKTIIDNPAIGLPAGFATTLELASDPAALDAYAAELQANNADAYQAALAETLSGAPSGGFTPEDIDVGPIYSSLRRNIGFIIGQQLEFNADGSARRTDSSGTIDLTWEITPEGVLTVTPPGGEFVLPGDFFRFTTCSPNLPLRARRVYLGSEFRLVLRGSALDLVSERSTDLTRFPENPECPDEGPFTGEPSFAFRWLEEAGTLDYTAADFAGREVVLNYWSSTPTRAVLGNAVAEAGQDFFTFNADGTGNTRITGRNFNWAIDADGHLEVAMTSGEFNEYVSLGPDIDGDVDSALNVGTTANGTFAWRSLQIERDPAFALNATTIPGTYVRGSDEQNTFSPSRSINPQVYAFNTDGTWLLNGQPPFGAVAFWSNPGGRLEYSLDFFGFTRFDTSWAPIRVIGDRYWVLEAVQSGAPGDPNFVDIGTRTGFATYYRRLP